MSELKESFAVSAEVVIYTANPAGVCAAVAAAREGAKVFLFEPDPVIGGLNTSGLNNNEQHHMHPERSFGGLCKVFFERLSSEYPETWSERPGWFNSQHFLRGLERLLEEQPGIELRCGCDLDSVEMEGGRITALRLTDGTRIEGQAFIDCSYEGDLMAAAGVSHRIGREARSADEPMAGVTWNDPVIPVDPYDREGLLPGLSAEAAPEAGSASPQVQNINFRTTLTNRADIRVPLPEPETYEPRTFELLARAFQAGAVTQLKEVLGIYPLPFGKFECNNNQKAILSISMRALATQWITATLRERRGLFAMLRQNNLQLMHFLLEDPRVPAEVRGHMRWLGLPADEYGENGHWPYEVYVREGRRMEGVYQMREPDVGDTPEKPDTICLGSHFIDCHWVDRYPVGREGFRNEGRLWKPGRVFGLPYRCMLPKPEQCENLLVPVCVSATHVAWCAIRLEPTWMMLGEAAGTAAAFALEGGTSLHKVPVDRLQSRLRRHGGALD